MSSTLHDFADVEPLEIREIKPIIINGSLFGYAGPSNRDENVVTVEKHRHSYDGGKQDYFRKFSAYNFDEPALARAEAIGATIIAVNEIDNDRVIEYSVSQFRDTELVQNNYESGNTNYYVPVEDAIHVWDKSDCTIIKDHQK